MTTVDTSGLPGERAPNAQRLYAVLRAASRQIALARSSEGLFRAVCEVAVTEAGFRFAWAGELESASETVCPVAWAGMGEEYLSEITIKYNDSPLGHGPTGTALRERRVAYVNDIAADPSMEPWRETARRFGFAASAAVPVLIDGEPSGCFGVYSSEKHRFTEQEAALLADIGHVIGVGLKALSYHDQFQAADSERLATEELLHIVFSTLDEAVLVIDPQSRRVEMCNDATERIFGYAKDEIVGTTSEHLHVNHDRYREFEERLLASFEKGEPFSCEYQMRRRDGTLFETDHMVREIRENDGSPKSVVTVIRDISERKRTERALQASEEKFHSHEDITDAREAQAALEQNEARFRALVQNAHDVTSILDTDATVFYESPSIEKVLGYEAPELIGTNAFDLVHPEDRQAVEEALTRIVSSPGEVITTSLRFQHRNGSWRVLNAICMNQMENEAIQGIVVNSRDITELAQMNEEVRRERDFLNQIMATSPAGITLVGTDGGITFANRRAREILGLKESEVGSRTYDAPDWQITAADGGEFPAEELPFARIRATGQPVSGIRHAIVHPERGRIILSINGTPDSDENGEFRGAVFTVVDITKQVRIEEENRRLYKELEQRVDDRTAELRAANQELEAFSYSVSHDLRAPLRHVDGYVALLRKRLGDVDDPEISRYLDILGESANDMSRLIDELLQFSRMGRAELNMTSVSLKDVVTEALKIVAPEDVERHIDWQIDSLPCVRGDRVMLRQVMVNLLSNAVKFTRHNEHARIEVGARSESTGKTTVVVKDNGAGFDMKYADKLFGVFQRLHQKNDYEGSGIGLANVKRIINRHGGSVRAEGRVGEGAAFYFTLDSIHEEQERQ